MAARPSPTAILPCRSSCRLVRGRYPHSWIRSITGWLALIAITLQVSCSGGAGGLGAGRVDPLPPVTLSISPGSAQISADANIEFTVNIQNASNPAVIWQVNGMPGGNSVVGTIASSGPLVASYTAPASVSAALTVTVTAVLQADATESASAMVTVNPLPGPQITISPANTDVVQSTSLQFNAAVQNGPQAVVWEVNNIAGGSASIGTISTSGFYAAPSQIPKPPTVTITAVLFSNSSISGSTSLTIVAPTPSISISPRTANVVTGNTLQFSATVQNSTSTVVWAVNGAPGGNSTDGTIISAGGNTATYSAPISIPAGSSPFTVTVTAALQANSSIFSSAGVTVISGNTLAGVYSWRNDNSLTGQNPQETTLTPSNVNSSQFGKLFSCPVDGAIFAQPLYVANVTIPNLGTHNVIYVATENDSIYAFDAAANPCQTLWKVSLIGSGESVVSASDPNLRAETDVVPLIGITGTPVIDPNTATLYVVSKTSALVSASPAYIQRLHALDLTNGIEKFGGPAVIQANVPGTGGGSVAGEISFQTLSLTENQRSALALAGGNVYVGFDSYADRQPFHGWLFAFDAEDLTKNPEAIFVSTPNGSNGGIGESGAAPSSDASGNVFVVTSDGTFDANSGGSDYAETLLELQVNTGFAIANPAMDTFTPFDETTLNLTNEYFGSTGVLLLPDSAGSSAHPHLAVAGNKAGNLYLLDRDLLGGFTVGGPDNIVQTLCVGASLTETPAYWTSNGTPTIYLAGSGGSLEAFPLANGTFKSSSCSSGTAVPASNSADAFSLFGASPVISSNGSSNGIVWALDTGGYISSAPAILHAYDANNLGTELYSSSSVVGGDAAGLAVKFAVPTVASGRVYVGTQTELSVFGLQ